MPINIDGSKGIRQNTTEVTKIPVGTTAQRPANPEPGMIRFNTDNGQVEGYDPGLDGWRAINQSFAESVIATGGTVTDIEQDGQLFRVHSFTSDGTFDVDRGGEVDFLVVGGGGGGGESASGTGGTGGGGGGGVVLAEGAILASDSYSITVGSGGSGNSNGSDSFFADLRAIGGGAGKGGNQGAGNDGGSGGGAGQNNSGGETSSGLQPGTNNNTSFNFSNLRDLGSGTVARFLGDNDGSTGGGGATQQGQTGEYQSGNTSQGYLEDEIPFGGDGFDASRFFGPGFGENGYFGGGGGGGVNNDSLSGSLPIQPALGGLGGGGDSGAGPSASHPASPLAEDGQPNTGGGGGGLGSNDNGDAQPNGTNGGSGIVLVRYRIG